MGSVSIQDNLHVLSSGDIEHIQREAAATSLDVTVIIDRVDSRDQLDRRTHDAITRPTTIAIGVDPDHRYTRTNFGNGTGIAQREFATISTSGNADFKDQHWGDGIVSVIRRAQSSARVGILDPPKRETGRLQPPPPPPPPPPVASDGIGFWGVMFWLTVAACVGGGLWYIFRRRPMRTVFLDPPPPPYVPPAPPPRSEPKPVIQAPYHPPSYRPAYSPPPVAPPPVPVYVAPPVVVHSGRDSNDLALGMMIGESLGEARAPRYTTVQPAYSPPPDPPPRPRPPSYTPPDPPDPPRRSYDDGGASSSWSSPDAGGSSSVFDGGGGGNFDSGGGGGDF